MGNGRLCWIVQFTTSHPINVPYYRNEIRDITKLDNP